MWSTERASVVGLIEFAAGAILLPTGVLLLRQAGLRYLDHPAGTLFWSGVILLALFGAAAFRIARRREYPWLLALVAVGLPLFDPTQAPYAGGFRVIVAIRDVLLIGATVIFIAQSIQRADELERKIHLEALAASYTTVVVLLLIQAMAADVLPPLRATWVASGLLIGWVVAWLVTSWRYHQ